MGAGGSLSNNFKSPEPPPLPPPFYTGNPHYGISRISGSSCDDQTASGTSTITLENRGFQNPRSSESLKNEELWHQRPSAPSLSSLRPQQETLLTYAAQMTGWQSGSGSAVPSMHQEVMELARTVSHLAAANQQLASAHTTLLAQLESLYLELNRERELRIESSRDSYTLKNDVSLRKRQLSSDDEENEKVKLAHRVANLEATIEERTSNFGIREFSWREKERKFKASLEELENRLASREDIDIQNVDCNNEFEAFPGASNVVIESKIVGQSTGRLSKKRNFEVDQNCRRIKSEKGCRGLRHEEHQKRVEDNDEADLSLEYQKAVDRIHLLEDELDNSCKHNILRVSNEPFITSNNQLNNVENETIDCSPNNESKSSDSEENTRGLLNEIERLNHERLEYQDINKKLMADVENQKVSIEKLRRDYEISRSQYEKVENSLMERKKQLITLGKDFDVAKSETTRLLNELQVYRLEKNTATAKIADLEKDLAKTTLATEQISKNEVQESSRLRKQLSEEITSKREQTKALKDALKEIQRLNEVIESGEKDEQVNGSEEIPEAETTPEEEVLDPEISVPRTNNMEEFRKELSLKREARQRAIAAVSSEMDRLRRELDAEKEAHSETSRVLDLLKSAQATNVVAKHEEISNVAASTKINEEKIQEDRRSIIKSDLEQDTNEADAQSLTDILKVSDELRASIRLQTEKIDDLRYHLECEPEGHRNRIANLKEIAAASREASGNRERQINKLKNLLAQIIAHLGDPRFRVEVTDDVRAEHDRQIEDVRRLKSLYDERLRVLVDLRDIAFKELTDVKDKLKGSRKENGGLEEDLKKAEEKIDTQDTEISNLESQLGLTKADCRDLQNQMSVINGLFTQMLLSASSADMDLDRLTRLLQENHDLISDMAREEGTEAAALPKLLLDLVEQVEGRGGNKSAEGETEKKDDVPKEENIAHNLPKVWRVLLELLSCHAVESPAVVPASLSTDPNSCYKSVDTPSGPRLVISVSKTYIRLKELILEKKHLEKEMNRMKQLNTHLESKLGEQEKRLSTVSSELSKTWNVVGRMQAQHQQLHTHEKILRYELQQKRKMLQELKQELEYCREKWESARQKNTNTEIEWRSLRREFAARKSLAAQDSFNNSGESGFSDERGDDSDEEDEAVGERVRIGPRRRARKENPRAPTPDTESEQPTDTELSEIKTGSTATPEQRTPTPETAEHIENVSTASTSTDLTDKSLDNEHEYRRSKPINPLDQALANVIQNLITIDESNASQSVMPIVESQDEDMAESPLSFLPLPENKESTISVESKKNRAIQERPILEDIKKDIQSLESGTAKKECTEAIEEVASTVSVFSIGPFPASSASAPAKSVQFSDPLIVGPSTQPSVLTVFGDVAEAEEASTSAKVDEINAIIAKKTQIIAEEEKSKKDDVNLVVSTSENCQLIAEEQKLNEEDVNLVASTSENGQLILEEKKSKEEDVNLVASTSENCQLIAEEKKSKDEDINFVTSTSENCQLIAEEKKPKEDDVNLVASTSENCQLIAEEKKSKEEDVNFVTSTSESSKTSSGKLEASKKAESAHHIASQIPSTSTDENSPKPVRTHEEVLAARADRLKRLEEQADWLMKKMSATSRRSSALSNRLEELHEVYGEAPIPPPMPDVLPNVRIPSNTDTRQQEKEQISIEDPNKTPPPDAP